MWNLILSIPDRCPLSYDRKLIGRQLERESLEKKYVKGRNITERIYNNRRIFFSSKENSKTIKQSPPSSVAAKEVRADNKTE